MNILTLGKLLCAVSSISILHAMEGHTRFGYAPSPNQFSPLSPQQPFLQSPLPSLQPSIFSPPLFSQQPSIFSSPLFSQPLPSLQPSIFTQPSILIQPNYPFSPVNQLTNQMGGLNMAGSNVDNEKWVPDQNSNVRGGRYDYSNGEKDEWTPSPIGRAHSNSRHDTNRHAHKDANRIAARQVSLMLTKYGQFFPHEDRNTHPIKLAMPASATAFDHRTLQGVQLKAAYHTSFKLSTADSYAVAQSLVATGVKTGVLNAANATYVGGGFLNGAEAQEESLCRQSTLFWSLIKNSSKRFNPGTEFSGGLKKHDVRYANHIQTTLKQGNGVLVSPNVTVFRKRDQGQYTNMSNSFDVVVVSSAAENIGKHNKSPGYWQNTFDKIDSQLAAFANEGVQSIVLCGWGCGAFKNDPSVIAPIYAQLLNGKYNGVFKDVVFALPDQKLHGIFGNELRNNGIRLS